MSQKCQPCLKSHVKSHSSEIWYTVNFLVYQIVYSNFKLLYTGILLYTGVPDLLYTEDLLYTGIPNLLYTQDLLYTGIPDLLYTEDLLYTGIQNLLYTEDLLYTGIPDLLYTGILAMHDGKFCNALWVICIQ